MRWIDFHSVVNLSDRMIDTWNQTFVKLTPDEQDILDLILIKHKRIIDNFHRDDQTVIPFVMEKPTIDEYKNLQYYTETDESLVSEYHYDYPYDKVYTWLKIIDNEDSTQIIIGESKLVYVPKWKDEEINYINFQDDNSYHQRLQEALMDIIKYLNLHSSVYEQYYKEFPDDLKLGYIIRKDYEEATGERLVTDEQVAKFEKVLANPGTKTVKTTREFFKILNKCYEAMIEKHPNMMLRDSYTERTKSFHGYVPEDPRYLYDTFADHRHDEFDKIDLDSEEELNEWYGDAVTFVEEQKRPHGGHPFEVHCGYVSHIFLNPGESIMVDFPRWTSNPVSDIVDIFILVTEMGYKITFSNDSLMKSFVKIIHSEDPIVKLSQDITHAPDSLPKHFYQFNDFYDFNSKEAQAVKEKIVWWEYKIERSDNEEDKEDENI